MEQINYLNIAVFYCQIFTICEVSKLQ